MKKIGTIALTSIALLTLAACGDKKDTASKETPNQPTASETKEETKPVLAVPEAKSNEDLYNFALGYTGFVVGGANKGMMANPEVIVFFDPQCPHCGTYWNATKVLHNDVKMKWIPVAILNKKSRVDGSHILNSSNPAATMTEHEDLLSQGRTGLQVTDIVEKFDDPITANTDFFALNMTGVPFTIYRNSAGEYGTLVGAQPLANLMKALDIETITLNTTDNSGASVVSTSTEVTASHDGQVVSAETPAADTGKPAEEVKADTPAVDITPTEVKAETPAADTGKPAEEVKADTPAVDTTPAEVKAEEGEVKVESPSENTPVRDTPIVETITPEVSGAVVTIEETAEVKVVVPETPAK